MLIGIDPASPEDGPSSDELGMIVTVGELPVAGRGAQHSIAGRLFATVIRKHRPTATIVEATEAMPGQWISSTFGRARGVIQGVLGALDMFVQASVWKRHLHLGAETELSRPRAINTWPEKATEFFARKKEHGRAEAWLIAFWGLPARFAGGGPHVP